MPGEAAGWFQGTADAVRKFIWVLEVINMSSGWWYLLPVLIWIPDTVHLMMCVLLQDYYKHKAIEHILILSGDQLYRMDYMELVQVGDFLFILLWGYVFILTTWPPGICHLQKHVDDNADITLSCAPVGERYVTTLHQVSNFMSTSSFSSEIIAYADFIFFVLEAELLTMG